MNILEDGGLQMLMFRMISIHLRGKFLGIPNLRIEA